MQPSYTVNQLLDYPAHETKHHFKNITILYIGHNKTISKNPLQRQIRIILLKLFSAPDNFNSQTKLSSEMQLPAEPRSSTQLELEIHLTLRRSSVYHRCAFLIHFPRKNPRVRPQVLARVARGPLTRRKNMQIHRLYSHTSAANAADYNDNRRKGSRDDSENPFPRLSLARVLYDVSSREREREWNMAIFCL